MFKRKRKDEMKEFQIKGDQSQFGDSWTTIMGATLACILLGLFFAYALLSWGNAL